MNAFQISLDKYLTASLYEDGFDGFYDLVTERISDEFYDKNEDWVMEWDGTFNKWVNKCFYKKSFDVNKTARIIERTHKLYKL
jgi:hypothetical protein